MVIQKPFYFEISLSVLNHLGRNLYRSFTTVLGEAISNAWDADAKNVYIYIDKQNNRLIIKDDGTGMEKADFQNKFLKIGYTKRILGNRSPKRNRAFIGRKGIGKLALLSCAERIAIISKTHNSDYIGGVIDNSGLDKAITDDLTPREYPLESVDIAIFKEYLKDHSQGTIIIFDHISDGITHSFGFLRKVIALYFRFSLHDKAFNIYLNDEIITISCLDDLALDTEYLWNINSMADPYLEHLARIFSPKTNEIKDIKSNQPIKGFIASVKKPRDLKITTMDEKVGMDLFVNGRLREKDILKHIPTARIVESYIYGQIHYDDLDDDKDRFTSSRESIVAEDPEFKNLLENLRKNILPQIIDDWDKWRRKHRKEGDSENTGISKKQRKAEELFNAVSDEYSLPNDNEDDEHRVKINNWVGELGADATFNFTSYAECFISENLIRRYIAENGIALSPEAIKEIEKFLNKERENKEKANINIELRKMNTKLSYLSMDGLAYLVDKKDHNKEACLSRDANEYKPIRDALAHTALLTDDAKNKLTTIYANIQERVIKLLTGQK